MGARLPTGSLPRPNATAAAPTARRRLPATPRSHDLAPDGRPCLALIDRGQLRASATFSGGLADVGRVPRRLSVTATAHSLRTRRRHARWPPWSGPTLVAARPTSSLGAAGGACGCLGVVAARPRTGDRTPMAVVSPISAVVAAVRADVDRWPRLAASARRTAGRRRHRGGAGGHPARCSRSGPMGRPGRESLLVASSSGLGSRCSSVARSRRHATSDGHRVPSRSPARAELSVRSSIASSVARRASGLPPTSSPDRCSAGPRPRRGPST